MTTLRATVVVMALGLASIVATVPTANAESDTANGPRAYHLALGDSLTFGYQLARHPGIVPPPPEVFDHGYVDVLALRLRAVAPDIQTVNLGCPGESTDTFLRGCPYTAAGGLLHETYPGSQLQAAAAFLLRHRGQVSPITMNLWGNDIGAVVTACQFDPVCIQDQAPTAIQRTKRNIGVIVGLWRLLAPSADVFVIGPFNAYLGALNFAAPLIAQLDASMADVTTRLGALYVPTMPAFNPPADIDAQTAHLCGLLECALGGTHPNDHGYELMAHLVWKESGYGPIDT